MNQRTLMDDYYSLPDRNGSFEAQQRTQSLVIEEIENRCREGKKNEENPYPRRRCAQRFQESSALLPDSIEKCILTNKSAPELAIAATNEKRRL
jgi:hypothetical protein